MFFYWEDFCLVMYVIYVSFQIGAGLYAVGRPVQKRNDEDGQIGTIQSLPLERGALFNLIQQVIQPVHCPLLHHQACHKHLFSIHCYFLFQSTICQIVSPMEQKLDFFLKTLQYLMYI